MPKFSPRVLQITLFTALVLWLPMVVPQSTPAAPVESSDIIQIDARQLSPAPAPSDFVGGTSVSPSGRSIGINNQFLLLDGKPWLPVMGEFHFSRYPEADWEEEILKMKAAGVQIVSSYIFWNHIEEVEGVFDWQGQRNLRHFVELCQKHGMYFFVRIGPWVHGESRYGGLPDWVVKESTPRTTAPRFMGFVNALYQQIGAQLKGLFWKDGGPVIGVQIENEYAQRGPEGGETYIRQLKKMAVAEGMDVPLYTITGWDNAVWPQGEFLPVYGGYPDAPWASGSGPTPANEVYLFRFNSRVSGDMGAIGRHSNVDQTDLQTPFLTAEVGGGLQDTYHRRPVLSADDVTAQVPVMIGSGANLLGYYMFQGGENPDGETGPLNESKTTGYPTDVPVKNYDFGAPLDEFGSERESYRKLKLFNYFLNDFGSAIAPMTVRIPALVPSRPADESLLRIAARTRGDSSFLFVNNHVRSLAMPAHKQVQVNLQLPSGPLLVPSHPVDVPGDSYFVWPVNMDLDGVRLRYSTAQPLCRMVDGNTVLYVFFAIRGVEPVLSFDPKASALLQVRGGTKTESAGEILISGIEPSTHTVVTGNLPDGRKLQVLVLTQKQAESATRITVDGRERLVLSQQEVYSDGQSITLRAYEKPDFEFSIWPSLPSMQRGNPPFKVKADDGIFKRYVSLGQGRTISAKWMLEPSVSHAELPKSDPRTVPSAEEIEAAPRWRIHLSSDAFAGVTDVFLLIRYQGDIARLNAGGKLLADDFYNGTPWCVGLKRFRPQLQAGDLELTIVPWRNQADVVLDQFAAEKRGDRAQLLNLTVIPEYQLVVR
jgi:beta-galactosidase